jgi:ferredoxin
MGRKFHIRVDLDKCIAAGQCVRAAPTLFAQRDEDGVVVVLDANPSTDLEWAATEAAHLCPAHVIVIEPDQ